MGRKNIFQLVEENYDIQEEIQKINKLFEDEDYFTEGFAEYSFKVLLRKYLFGDWEYRGTCITIEEFLKRVNADIFSGWKDVSEEAIINYLEVMENFLKLYQDNRYHLERFYNIACYETFKSIFCKLINSIEKKMGLIVRECGDKMIIYPQNAPLEQAVDLCDDEDVQWDLIRYARGGLALSEKRRILSSLGLYIEPILKSRDLQHAGYKQLESDIGFMLNCFHVRHNNKEGAKAQDYIITLTDDQLEEWYDKIYNGILSVIIINDHIKTQNKLALLKPQYNWRM